jgi:mannitol-1-/sugar-/sorbitol-6-phosphatase
MVAPSKSSGVEPRYEAVCFDLFGTLVEDDGSAIAGSREALEAMPGGRWAIVTSCGTQFARILIARAALPPPPILVTSDDVARNKPDPDGYLTAAKRLQTPPERILVVEDSRQGIAAGRAAGMDVLAILRGRSMNVASEALYLAERLSAVRWNVHADGTIGFLTASSAP